MKSAAQSSPVAAPTVEAEISKPNHGNSRLLDINQSVVYANLGRLRGYLKGSSRGMGCATALLIVLLTEEEHRKIIHYAGATHLFTESATNGLLCSRGFIGRSIKAQRFLKACCIV